MRQHVERREVLVGYETSNNYTFLDGGMEVDVASIRGGEIPIDPQSFLFMIKSTEDERYLPEEQLDADGVACQRKLIADDLCQAQRSAGASVGTISVLSW